MFCKLLALQSMGRGGSREADTLLEASEGKDMGEPAANASTLKKFQQSQCYVSTTQIYSQA